MKLDDDFTSMFVMLDTTKKGFLTVDEVANFYQTLFCQTLDIKLVQTVVRKICSSDRCNVKHFQTVLVTTEEWRQCHDNAYWDFMSLDRDGSCNVSLSNALFLARSVKGSEFSLNAWNEWNESVHGNALSVSWDQFKSFLHFEPGKKFELLGNESDYNKAHSSLAHKEFEEAVEEYQFYKESLEKDESYSALLLQERQQYEDNVHFEASRLVNRWNVGGVEAVIHDDGAEWEATDNQAQRDDVTIAALMEALEEKYEILRDKLMWEIVHAQAGNGSSKKLMYHDLEEKFTELRSREKDMRRNNVLDTEAESLYGGVIAYSHNIRVLMGETADAYKVQWEETKQRYTTYQNEGRSTQEINAIFEKENLERMKGAATTAGKILIELWNRQKKEKKHLLERVKTVSSQANGQSQRLAIFVSLYRQCERARERLFLADDSSTITFDASASGVAVAERTQTFEPTRFSEDAVRQDRLATGRLRVGKQRSKTQNPPTVGERLADVSQDKDLGAVGSWMEITKLFEKKHDAEREMMIYFLHNIAAVSKNIQKLTSNEQENRRNDLSKNFDNWKLQVTQKSGKDLKAAQRSHQLTLLHEGIALYRQQLKLGYESPRDADLAAILLGQLQTLQDVQYQDTMDQLANKTISEIYQLRKAEYRAIRDEYFENIALLVFGSQKLTPDEQRLVDIVSQKYDLLREKVLLESIRDADSEESRMKQLKALKEEEKNNRGNVDVLATMCRRLKIAYSSNEIFGPLLSRFRLATLTNQNVPRKLLLDEASMINDKEVNILSEIARRYRDESQAVLNDVRGSGDVAAAINREVVKQKWQTAILEADKTFLPSAMSLALFERARSSRNIISLKEDNTRYIRCAQERFPSADPFNENANQHFVSDHNDATTALHTLLLRHGEEWKRLRSLMNDVTAEELREAASLMTPDERVKRLAEINVKRKELDITTEDCKEDLVSLLEEAAALKHVSRRVILHQLVGEEETNDVDVFVSLLADLQEEQMTDSIHWFDDAMQMKTKEAESIAKRVENHMDASENIFAILCKYEGTADDENLLQALEDKYDALRDKLLAEALMRQIGEENWRRMSEKERQKRLMQLKMEEMRLRKEGKFDELAKLLGDSFANDARLKALLGESRDKYNQRLKERLEARKRGETIPEDDSEEDLHISNGSSNPLVQLASRFDEERDALMKMLSGQDDMYMSEKERQAALLKLRQSRLRAVGEDRYDAAALVTGLAEREVAAEKRSKSDRERQRELARQRLNELRSKAKGMFTILEEDEVIVQNGDRAQIEEAVLKKLNFLQNWERTWLTSVLEKNGDPFSLISSMSVQQVTDRLQDLRSKVPSGLVPVEDHYQPLSEAALCRQVALARHQDMSHDKSRDELDISLLAALQEIQDAQQNVLSNKLADLSHSELIAEQEKLVSQLKSQLSENLPNCLFSIAEPGDANQDLIDAVQGKYDAVIDAAVTFALPKKVGVSNWDNMTPDERKMKSSDLSSQIKDLMANGHYEDAINLLAEGLSEEDRQALERMLLGDEEELRAKDLQEREMRRAERIKNGMSEDEADRLFKDEELLFEEQLKKKRKNILEGLAMDTEAEKDALLKALQDAKDNLEAERKRQLFLAKLRLQERQLRRESDLSAIAKLLAMSRDLDDAQDKEKQRQLALARARVEAMKRKREAGITEEEDQQFELRLDSDDVVVLADAVMREMEAKHAVERTVLLQVMEITAPDSSIRKRAESTPGIERSNRIKDLRELRRHWRNEDPHTMVETKDEQWYILKEASALQLASLCTDENISEEKGQAFMLADLQQEQKKETAFLLTGLLDKKPDTIRKMALVQRQARTDFWYDNVASTLLGASVDLEDREKEEEVVKALEEKYDVLKDKLLAEALMKQLGEKKWAALSERERQHRIMQIKQQERKLRIEGKHDEVARLFNELSLSENELSRIFGEEQISQREALKKRLERRKELRAERERKGLSTDDASINEELDNEEKIEKKKRINVLLTLDRNLESERDALLADLRRQNESVSEERRRQLAIAKLRRERRQVEAEEKLGAIALIFQTAKKDEATLSASLSANRQRQASLAQERLTARKAQRKRKQAIASLTDPKIILEKLKAIGEEKTEGSSAERLLLEMEKRHLEEKETLMLLLLTADEEKSVKEAAKLTNQRLQEELESFATYRRGWREERLMRAIGENADIPLTDEQRSRLSRYVVEQNKGVMDAVVKKSEALNRESSEQTDVASLMLKVGGEWIAELQQTQDNEIKVTSELIADKTDEILDLLTQDQKRARREAWLDNIGKVVFGLALPGQDIHRPASSSSSIEQEERAISEEGEEKMKEIEEELAEAKKNIEKRKVAGEAVDTEAALSQLEQQFSAKKETLSSDLKRQHDQVREKLRERRQRKAESEYEAHAAAGMVMLAEKRLKARENRSKTEASKQKNLMQERLAARREKRRQEAEAKVKSTEPESVEVEAVESKPEKKRPTPSPFDAMRRERTVIDVEVSQKDKEKMLADLETRSMEYQEKIRKEKELQKQKIQKRLKQVKQTKENMAEEMLKLYEREKTIIQEKITTSLTRQKTMLTDRIEKLKTEKTMTMKEKSDRKKRDFSKVLQSEDMKGMNEDDRMKKTAEELQKKFMEELEQDKQQKQAKSQEQTVEPDLPETSKKSESAASVDDSLPPRPQTSSRKLDQKQVFKEKMMKRKKNKRDRQEGLESPSSEDQG